MEYLYSRPKSYEDESLESYLLRLSQQNYFDEFYLLALTVKDWLLEQDKDAANAFPLNLQQINLYHAKFNSSSRTRALKLFESLLEKSAFSVFNLSIKHCDFKYSRTHATVKRQATRIPLSFLRSANISICPKCLIDNPYIRQIWHIAPYNSCHKHKCQLVSHCPECMKPLNYMDSESIVNCECGYNLLKSPLNKANENDIWLANLLVGKRDKNIPISYDIESLLGMLFWFTQNIKPDFDSSLFRTFLYEWPQPLLTYLNTLENNGKLLQTNTFNKTKFQDIFGKSLDSSIDIPHKNNPVRMEVIQFLAELVESNPKAKIPNIADILMPLNSVAALLGKSTNEVYRLYEEGYLKLAFLLKSKSIFSTHKPAFFLRQVIELFQAGYGNDEYNQSDW